MEQDVEKFAKQHGNYFHAQVVSFLRKAGWSVTVSPFYRDIATDKAREADIFADKVFDIPGGVMTGSPGGSFPVRLLIECKYVKNRIVFWFDQKDAAQAEKRIVTDIPVLKPFHENSNIERHHWYAEKEVAKLFATYNPNKEERQPENEIIFSSIDKVLNCLIYHRNTLSNVTQNPGRNSQPRINYPLIVVDNFSKMVKTTLEHAERFEPLDKESWFPVEVNYAYISYAGEGIRFQHLEYFLVDVVNFTRLGDYLALLEKNDIEAAKPML